MVCNQRNGAPSTTDIDDEKTPKRIGEMLGFTRIHDGEVKEEDLQAVVKNTEVPLKSYYKNEALSKMYKHYQNMCRTCIAKE